MVKRASTAHTTTDDERLRRRAKSSMASKKAVKPTPIIDSRVRAIINQYKVKHDPLASPGSKFLRTTRLIIQKYDEICKMYKPA